MHVLGSILVTVGALFGLTGDWLILRSAYRQGVSTLVTCLTLLFGLWLYALLDMRRPKVALILSFGGLGVALLGFRLWGVPIHELF